MLFSSTYLTRYLSHPQAKRVAYLLIALSIIWISINLLQSIALFFDNSTISTTPVKISTPLNPPNHLAKIPDWHLFGQPPKKVANTKMLPLSSLNLKLVGIFLQSATKNSTALITDASGNTKLYTIGDIVPGDATLYDIFPDNIVIERDGELEKLTLPNRSMNFGTPQKGLP